MTPLQSGFRSSEFWATVVVAALGGAMALPEGAPTWKVVAGAACAALPVMFYAGRRSDLKQAHLEAAAGGGAAETPPQ